MPEVLKLRSVRGPQGVHNMMKELDDFLVLLKNKKMIYKRIKANISFFSHQ